MTRTRSDLRVDPTLSVSIVVFNPDSRVLRLTLRSLVESIEDAHAAGLVDSVAIDIIDNSDITVRRSVAAAALRDAIGARPGIAGTLNSGGGNVGYGRAHNFAVRRATSRFHLVLNPDVLMARNAIRRAIQFMAARPEVALLGPGARDGNGMPQRLCKRYPSVLALGLRGFAPRSVRRLFRSYLGRYELRDVLDGSPLVGIPIVAGTFMFFRSTALKALDGFDERFFLYFEDFDLCLRTGRLGKIAYVSDLNITHFGGGASRKGPAHIAMFVASAWKFFRKHGWRFVTLDDRGLDVPARRLEKTRREPIPNR